MADHSAAGFGKDPLVTSHGDALADQSFQSLKSKEIRDSLSPTEMRFQSMTLNNPNTTGWNVQSSKEVSPDGRGFRAETVATTDGVENVNGGIAEFKGRNEQRSSAHHEGDDKNFLKKAMESSNSHLQEKVVIGDENSGRTEVRTSSTKSTSSSQVIQSSTNVEYENGIPIQQQPHPQKYLMDNNRIKQQDFEQLQQQEQQRLLEEQRIYEQKFQQQRQHQLNQQELHTTEQRQNTQKKNISQNIQTQETHEKNKRYVDMDKASPEYQQHVQHLMQQPGEVISSTVEYPKPNVKMITTVKRLPDGTIVRNKRYETEELTPTTPTARTTSTNPNQVPTRRDSPQPPTGKYQPDSSPQPRSSEDMVDSANTRHIHGSHTDDVETKFSSIKKSSSKFSTQTTSETIKEFDEHHPQDGPRPRPKTNDFSTHGFPSVRADKPTQEYPSERPHTAHPTHSPASHPGAARPKEDVVPRYTDDTDNISERRVNTKDGEVIIVSSEKKRNVKTSSNSERIVETEHIVHDDQPYQQSPHKTPQDFSTHGFPSIREPTRQQPNYPSEREMQAHQQDFHLDNLPPGHRITSKNDSPQGDEEVVVVSSQKFHTAKQSTNIERTIEHDIIRGNQDGSYPHIQPNKDSATPYNYTVTTPGEQIPRGEYPGSFQKPNSADYSTQGFPSVKIPVYVTSGKEEPHNGYPAGTPKQPSNDYTQQSYPSATAPSRPAAGLPSSYNQHPGSPRKSPTQDYSTQGFPSVRSPSKTTPTHGYPSNVDGPRPTGTPEQLRSTPTAKPQSRTQSPNKYKTPNTTVRETTERVIRKEKEVDSAHRAFAASLRSSSPLDHTDYHTRHTPRSSVSSTRTFRRDMREGSHDSAPSEASRITTTTITRNTPPRVVGGRTVVTKSVTTKTVPGSNDSLNVISPRATKSPSPGKTVTTTTTTTRTQTSKDVPKVTEKSPTKKPSSQPQQAPSSRSSTPSFSSKKPATFVMKDDHDDDDMLNKTSPFSSPSSRSRTPQKIFPKVNDKPQDDWQLPRQPDSDEGRTVNKETMFENPEEKPLQPHKPKFEQPNVEWIIVDDQDNYDTDGDNDSFAPEVVDAQLNVRKTTTKLIAQEKQIPVAPRKKAPSTATTTTTVTTKQFHTTPSKSHIKPNDKSPSKTKPLVSKTPQQIRTGKPLTDSKPVVQTPCKTPSKTLNNKSVTKRPVSAVPSYVSPQRKPQPTTSADKSPLKKTLTTSKLSMEKTTKLIETERLKDRGTKTETTHKILTIKPKGLESHPPHYADDEHFEGFPQKLQEQPEPFNPDFCNTQDIFYTPQPDSPEFNRPQNTQNEATNLTPGTQELKVVDKPRHKSPASRKPQSPGFQKLQRTFDEHSPRFGKPYISDDDEPIENYPPEGLGPQNFIEDHIIISETSKNFYPDQQVTQRPQQQSNQPTPGTNKPLVSKLEPSLVLPEDSFEPHQDAPYYLKPQSKDFESNKGLPSYKSPQEIYEANVVVSETYQRKVPESEMPKKSLKTPENTTNRKPYGSEDKPIEGPTRTPYSKRKPIQNYKQPGTVRPEFEPLDTDDDEYPTENENSLVTSKKTVAKHIQKFETNFMKTHKPKPQKETKTPTKASPQALQKLPKTPVKPQQHKETTKIEAYDTEEEEQFENTTEFVINSKQKYVTSEKQSQFNEAINPNMNVSSRNNEKSPERQLPEESKTTGSRSPQRFISPTRNQNKPKESTRKAPEEPKKSGSKSPQRIISPTRTEMKPKEPFTRRPHSPNEHFSPNRNQTQPRESGRMVPEEPQNKGGSKSPQRFISPTRAQKKPEKPVDERSKSPNKYVSPQRPQKTNDSETFTTAMKATKVVKENTTKEFHSEQYPEGQEPSFREPNVDETYPVVQKPSRKPNVNETFIEFESNSTQKRNIIEDQITQFEEPQQPNRKPAKLKPTRESSPTKIQELPEKRAQSPNKYVSPTRTERKPSQTLPVDQQTFKNTLRTSDSVAEKIIRKSGEKDHPKDNIPLKQADKPETKPMRPKFYPKQTSDTEDDEPSTQEIVIRQEVPQPHSTRPRTDSKSNPKSVSPTFGHSKPFEKPSVVKLTEPVKTRSQSPNKSVSPSRTEKKPNEEVPPKDNKTFLTSFTTTNIVRKQTTHDDDNAKYQQIKNTHTEEPLGKKPESINKPLAPIINEKSVVKNNATIETSSIVTEKTDKDLPHQQYPEKTIPYKKPSSPSYKTKQPNKPDFEDEDEAFLETNERVIISKTCKITEDLVKEPETPLRDISPKHTQNEAPHKPPQEPAKKSQLPQRDHEEPTNEDEILQISFKTKKTVEEKTTRDLGRYEKHPEKPEPQEKNYKPETRPEDEILTQATGHLITSKTHLGNEKVVQEFRESNKPQTDILPSIASGPKAPKATKISRSPTRPQKKPDQTILSDEETLTKIDKTTKFPAEKINTEKPKAYESSPFKTTETDGDETILETTELVFETTDKPRYPDIQQTDKKPQYITSEFDLTNDKQSFVHTSEFVRNTSQKLIKTQQKILEIENEPYYTDNEELPRSKDLYSPDSKGEKSPKTPSKRQQSPVRSPSSKTERPKSIPADDKTFKKSLRTTHTVTNPKHDKPHHSKSTGTDENETDTDTEAEDLLIETCENIYVVEKNVIAEKEQEKFLPTLHTPGNKSPKGPRTLVESIETVEKQNYPKEEELFSVTKKPSKHKQPFELSQEAWLPKQVTQTTTNVNEQFIEGERLHKETPDGAFISKTTEPSTPTSPTFRKKGAGRSDTFEERCRQILGMDNYGDTSGSYKQQPFADIEEKETIATKNATTVSEEDLRNAAIFQVKVEDCDEDDEPFSIDSVKQNVHKIVHTTEKRKNEPKTNERTEPKKKTENFPNKPEPKDPKNEHKSKKDENNEFEQTIIKTTTVHKKTPNEDEIKDKASKNPIHSHPKAPTNIFEPQDYSESEFEQTITETKRTPKNEQDDKVEPDFSGPEIEEEKFVKKTKKSEIKITKKPSPTSTPRSNSPSKNTSAPRSLSPTKGSPAKDLEPKLNKKSPQNRDESTSTIKDRLRSSTRKTKSPAKHDQVEGSESSPEHSPTRFNERRRSSNISVTTEIIIDHADSDTPHKKEKSPTIARKPHDSVYKEIIDSTVLPEKLTRRLPVTERKESAPVHRVTSKDKDTKMSRSTSENLIKVKNTETPSSTSKTPTKSQDHRRPNKCFATKSINLSATDRLVNSKEMENVIIDIQHAKSSREPSPDKIVPTPVPANLDTGKPRYPDMVQEPEDDRPKRNYQVKNIPIFEEENNSYVGCHITEINMEKSRHTTYDSLDYEEQILKNPVVEAPPSLDYISVDKPVDDESLLTVHEKVNKFQTISENVSKPKTINTTDSEDNIYSSIKLAPSAPQKSPELVRTISRHISKQTDLDYNDEPNEDYPQISHNDDYVECLVNNKKTTKEFKVSHHEKTNAETAKTAEKCQQPGEYVDDHDDHDDDELVPHTATHTTIIEERRQKDILNRPSVFDSRNKKPTATATTTTKTLLKCNKSPVKDSEKIRPDIKSRTIPTSAVTNTATEQAKATTTTTTTTINATTNKPKQSPQRKDSDIDYELRGSNVETGVRNIISKQTKVYNNNKHNNNNNDTSSDSKTNDLKKLTTTTSNKKPEKHMPVRLTPSKNPDEHDLSADDNEMIVYSTETTDIDIGSQVVNEDLNTEISNRQIPLNTTTIHKKVTTTAHSSTHSSPTKEHLVKLTDKHPLKSNQITTNTSIKTYETIEKADDIDETVLEPSTKKSPTQTHQKTPKMSTTVADSVAAKRSLFESNNGSQSTTHIKRTPVASPMSGRRPSYMDHTKSSLEHTRKDSLEINKTNYSRKPSQPEEELTAIDRNSTVKFDVPHGKRATTPRTASVTEDINVEEIFELEILEKLLETVQSYEIRRRIRAQIRLIKKNQKNELMSNSVTDLTTKTVKTSKMDGEETDTATSTDKKRKPEEKTPVQTTQAKDMAASHISSTKKEYIFEETYHPTTRRSPKPNRYPYEEEMETSRKPTRSQSPQPAVCRRNAEHERHHSPEKHKQTEVVKHHSSRITKQEYHYKDEHDQEEVLEVRHETSPTRRSPSPGRKPHSSNSSPERRYASPELRNNDRNRSPQMKSPQSSRPTGSRSPDNKIGKAAASYEKQESVKTSSIKPQTKRTTTTSTKSKPEDKTPVWADRKNILKTPTSTTTKKPSSTTLDSRAGYTKTIKSTTSQKMTSNKSSFVDDDCVTSSYGIGPTDENGLPLFGIRALKKKKPSVEPSETTEVTGYVVEEKYYSDNKTKPTLERKEFIYSTNPEELQKLQKQVEVTTNKKSLKDVEIKESKQAALISKATTPALRSSPEDDFLDSTTKYGRRGSVKEMSEKFIQKEAASSVTEKSNNYPKAGLILRTNSRKSSRDIDNENESFETFKTTRSQQHHTSSVLADSDDNQFEYEVEEVASRHSGRFITESESECDSIKTQREFKQVTSSSSMATRSFLNSQGEEKVVTNVSDCLERMRNADNVVEEGDTAEDQEARALLNKFLGASIIMKGVESSLPATNRQSKIITTTTTSSNLSDDNDGDNNAKHEVKTTRITKTIKSGSSSTPVTYTTCDIEEIWDEEILKELLEQARTYEERRKIRSRLRELMADREEQKQQKSTSSTTEKTETKEEDGAVVTTTTKVTTRTVAGSAAKPVTPFAKFKQLDKQNSQQSAKSPTTPTTTGGGSTASPTSGNQPIFKFTDPALNAKAATVKEQLLQWCQSKTQEYENIEITNFSTSWNNGLAFCALIHHFLPDAFDYNELTPKNRRKNFELAFTVADEKAGIAPLLDVEDMVVMQRPDWKCVFVYVQSIYRRFRNCQ